LSRPQYNLKKTTTVVAGGGRSVRPAMHTHRFTLTHRRWTLVVLVSKKKATRFCEKGSS